jgi:hypothetical protein
MKKLSLICIGVLSLLISNCNLINSSILDGEVAVVWTAYDEFDLSVEDLMKLPHVELTSSEKKSVARGLELLGQMTEEEMMVPTPAAVVGDIMIQKTGDYRFVCNDEIVLSVSELPPYYHTLLSMNYPKEWARIVSRISSKMEQAKTMRQ